MSPNSLGLRFHHGGVSVPDLEAAIAWWRDVLEFEVEHRFDIAAIPARIAMVRSGDLRIELFEVPGAAPLPQDRRTPNLDLKTHGNKHVAFQVADAMAALDTVRERGADIAMVVNEEGRRGFFLRDQAGNLVEVVEEPRP